MTAQASLVELCLLRPWPGNVRELVAEIRAAACAAVATGTRVAARHLPEMAGSAFGNAGSVVRSEPLSECDPPLQESGRRQPPGDDAAWHQRIKDALRANGGNVTATARALGLHRNQLRRFIERRHIDDAADRDHDASD